MSISQLYLRTLPLGPQILGPKVPASLKASACKNYSGAADGDRLPFSRHLQAHDCISVDHELNSSRVEPRLHVHSSECSAIRRDHPLSTILHRKSKAAPEDLTSVDQVRLPMKGENEGNVYALREPLNRIARTIHEGFDNIGIRAAIPKSHDVPRELIGGVRRQVNVSGRFGSDVLDDREKVLEATMNGTMGTCGEVSVASDPFGRRLLDDEDAFATCVAGGERCATSRMA